MVRHRQPTFLAEARILSLSRAMTLPAIGAGRRGGQMRLDVRLGMTSGAFNVTREPGENSLSFELVTKGAVGAKPGSRIQPRLFVQVLCMREAEQKRLRLAELRIRPQVLGTRGLQGGMAHLAQFKARFPLKVLLMAGEALSVAWGGPGPPIAVASAHDSHRSPGPVGQHDDRASGSRRDGRGVSSAPTRPRVNATAAAVSSTPPMNRAQSFWLAINASIPK